MNITQTGPPSPSPWLRRLVEILDTWDTTDDGTSYFDSSRVLIRELRQFITPDAVHVAHHPGPYEHHKEGT